MTPLVGRAGLLLQAVKTQVFAGILCINIIMKLIKIQTYSYILLNSHIII